MKKIFLIFSRAFLIGIALVFLVSVLILLCGIKFKPKQADCIIILGCQVKGTQLSYFLKARLDEGLRLFNSGYADYIIVSGGMGEGEHITEAFAMKEYLIKNGVPQDKIIEEDKSNSTITNIKNSKAIMDNNNFKDAIIVSNKYHLLRAYLIAKKFKIKASMSGVFVSDFKYYEVKGFIREIAAFMKFLIIDSF